MGLRRSRNLRITDLTFFRLLPWTGHSLHLAWPQHATPAIQRFTTGLHQRRVCFWFVLGMDEFEIGRGGNPSENMYYSRVDTVLPIHDSPNGWTSSRKAPCSQFKSSDPGVNFNFNPPHRLRNPLNRRVSARCHKTGTPQGQPNKRKERSKVKKAEDT